jgi:Protein of unknown function (DUF2924)
MTATTIRRVERPAESQDALLSLDASLSMTLADLEGLGVEGLRRQWRNGLGGAPPAHLPRWLLVRILGYRLQAAAHGDLDKATRRAIRMGKEEKESAPFDRRDPQTREGVGLKPGTLLVREWKGKLERVMVLEEGFAWEGATYCSLSQIARAMTGTSWNGHRFFGLRQRKVGAVAQPNRTGAASGGVGTGQPAPPGGPSP